MHDISLAIDEWFLNLFGNISFFDESLIIFIALAFKVFITILFIIVCVAYLTLLERKLHGFIHMRKGPNVAGFWGLLQPICDAIKVMFKETIIPSRADKFLFLLAPVLTFVISLLGFVVIPFDNGAVFADINVGILYLLAISSLGVYGLIFAGWSSNSKYAFFGAIRSSAQMLSYEMSIGLIIISVVLCTGSLNLSDVILAQQHMWNVVKLFPMAVLFFIVIVAETNRHPFDLPEAESDIVSGYHIEYSGFAFALFFLGEYSSMMLMSSFFTVLFLGGWLPLFEFFDFIPGFVWFMIKVVFLLMIMISLRSALPRYRYDQLMHLGWKVFLPLAFTFVIILAIIIRIKG